MRRLALLAVLVLAGCGGGGSKTTTTTGGSNGVRLGPAFGSFASLPGIQDAPPPWTAGNGPPLAARLKAMGIQTSAMEGAVVHIHQHLDVYVDGRKVTLPANVGISVAEGFLSPLHTHDTSGIIHVESHTANEFSLGQVFGVWGVPLNRTTLGSLHAGGGKELRAWVNGRPVHADPTRIVLAAHQEIVIAFGTAAQMPKPVPSSYAFAAGL
jgi:hypothetical protein